MSPSAQIAHKSRIPQKAFGMRRGVRQQGERLLYSEDRQRSVLGAACLNNSLMRGPLVSLSVNDLVGSQDRTIYALMLEFSENNEPFDAATLALTLEERGELERAGGAAYLGIFVDGAVPEPLLVDRHVEVIKSLSRLRQLQSLAEILSRDVNELGANPDHLLERLESTVQSLGAGYDLEGNLLPSGPRNLSRRPELLTLSQVEAREVSWLWRPYLASAMLAMLSGDPGAGKTFVGMAIAAAVTTGREPCTGDPRKPADVVYLSIENSPQHVLRPRFDLLGGDPNRFHLLLGSLAGQGEHALRSSVTLSDVSVLHEALKKTKATLLVVDPIQSYLGAKVDAHRSNETRPVLDGLARLAEEHGCCVLLVRHLSKASTGKAIHRGLGSIDLTGAARTELLAGSSADDASRRALVQVKSNLGLLGPTIGYSIEADGSFRWTGESGLTAQDLLGTERRGEDSGAVVEAEDLLRSTLKSGPRSAREVQAEARNAGVAGATLRRAKSTLKVRSRKSGMHGGWEWCLP